MKGSSVYFAAGPHVALCFLYIWGVGSPSCVCLLALAYVVVALCPVPLQSRMEARYAKGISDSKHIYVPLLGCINLV